MSPGPDGLPGQHSAAGAAAPAVEPTRSRRAWVPRSFGPPRSREPPQTPLFAGRWAQPRPVVAPSAPTYPALPQPAASPAPAPPPHRSPGPPIAGRSARDVGALTSPAARTWRVLPLHFRRADGGRLGVSGHGSDWAGDFLGARSLSCPSEETRVRLPSSSVPAAALLKVCRNSASRAGVLFHPRSSRAGRVGILVRFLMELMGRAPWNACTQDSVMFLNTHCYQFGQNRSLISGKPRRPE